MKTFFFRNDKESRNVQRSVINKFYEHLSNDLTGVSIYELLRVKCHIHSRCV